jgi:hypothetical protein
MLYMQVTVRVKVCLIGRMLCFDNSVSSHENWFNVLVYINIVLSK